MRCTWCVVAVSLLACGGSTSDHQPPDGPVDGVLADAPIDTPGDGSVEPPVCGPMMAPRIATAGPPSAIAVGDVNADGKRDLVVTITTPAALDLMLGNGDGTFQPAVRTVIDAAAVAPIAPALADVDGDGDVDVVIALASAAANGVQIVRGDGQGTFTLGDRLPGTAPTSIGLADLDGNGSIDIVETSAVFGSGVVVRLGTGNGAFAAPIVLDPAGAYDAIAIADMDADQKPDIIAAGNELAVFRGAGNGTFASPIKIAVTADYAHQLAIGDLNGDAMPDIVTAGWIATEEQLVVETWLGSGGGAVVAQSAVVRLPDHRSDLPPPNEFQGSFPGVVALADLDLDGKLDIAVTDQSRDVIGIVPGTATGNLGGFTEYAVGRAPVFLATGELDGDGRPDLVAVDADHVEVVLGSASGPRAPRGLRSGLNNEGIPVVVAVGDVDGDGVVDFVDGVTSYDSQFAFIAAVFIVRSSGAIGFFLTPSNPDVEEADHDDLALRDLDGDGDLDLVMSTDRVFDGFVSVLLNAGDGTFGPRVDYTVGPARDLAIGDLDGDQRPELVVATSDPMTGETTTTVLVNDGAGAFTAAPAIPSQSQILLRDFNSDGRLDLVTSGNVAVASVRLGNGDATFGAPIDTATAAAVRVVVADVDADGILDLGGGTATETLILLGHGDGTFASAPSLPAAPGGLLALADLDHVAPIDVVGTRGAVERAGTGARTEAWTITASDFVDATGDGHADAIGIGPRANTVFVLSSPCP